MSEKRFLKQVPTFAARTYRGGRVMRAFLGMGEGEDSFYPETWISSFTEAKNKIYVENEGITRVCTEEGERLITEAVSPADFGEGRADSGVLVKLLDAGERLGIQVHPTKEYARRVFDSAYGKTECWYILSGREDMDEPASVYIGFRENVTAEDFRRAFEEQDVEGMLRMMHRIAVKPGDVILVTGGTPHAIGAGCFLVEIQEPSDYTMRAEKVTVAGEALTPKQIHYGVGEEEMLRCFEYLPRTEEEIREKFFLKGTKGEQGETRLVRYEDTPCFALSRVEGGEYSATESCFVTVVVLEDGGALLCDGEICPLTRGDLYFIKANTPYTLKDARAVICYPPALEG